MSLAALGGSVNAACTNYHPGPTAVPAEAAVGAPRELWRVNAGRTIGAPVVIDGGIIYAAGVDRVVHAISLDSGRVRWGFRLTGIVLGGVVRADSSVYVASTRPLGNVLALRAATGQKRWSVNVGEVSAPLALVGNNLLVTTRKGDLIALAPANGMMRWRRRIGYARSAAVPVGSAIAIATLDSLFLVNAADGHVLHRRAAPGVVLGEWRQVGDRLIAATTDSTLLAVHAADLSPAWSSRLDAPAFASPAVIGDTAYVATRIGTLYRVMLTTGEATRLTALGWPLTAGPTVYPDGLLVGGADGIVRGLDRTGREQWRVAVWRPVDVAPIVLPDGFLVVGGNGDFHRYVR